jgi:DNA modification methylase
MQIAFDLKWWMRGMILWLKGVEPDEKEDTTTNIFTEDMKFISKGSTGWGSFGMATNPILRDNHEFILVFNKGKEKIPKGNSGILSDEFVNFTNAEWIFSPASATSIGHPAPFPDELARRCILLYSNEGDVVLGPFGGSGTTFKVARFLGRKPVIYEIMKEYVPVIKQRIQEKVKIQSKAWDKYFEMKEVAPDLYDKPTRKLLEIARNNGVDVKASMSKVELMTTIMTHKKNKTLEDFLKK